MKKGFFPAVLSALCFFAPRCLEGVTPFKEGEKVVFLGDSITHGGDFIRWSLFLYNLRNPGQIFLENAGIAGDVTGGGLERLSNDVLRHNPNRVFIMFGMNDLGVNLYANGEKDLTDKRLASFEKFTKNLTALCDELAKKNIKVVLMTPTPYNQYEKGMLSTYNEFGLGRGAEFIRKIAAERSLEVVDFHVPFTEIIKKLPSPSPMRVDKVHPNLLGQLLMAYLLWKEMNLDGKMGHVILDGSSGAVKKAFRAALSDFRKTKKGIAFTYSPEKLPFITDPKNHAGIDNLVPFTEEFNKEFLQIRNLPPGKYLLFADKRQIGKFDARELAEGINFAVLRTPAFYQAHRGYRAIMTIKSCQSKLRCIVQGDRLAVKENGDINDLESCFAAYQRWYDSLFKDKDPSYGSAPYYREVFKNYKSSKRNKAKIEKDLEEAVSLLRQECRKVSYTLELMKK